MIIVYLSLALVIAAIIVCLVSASKTVKLMNGSIGKISKAGAKIRKQTENITEEKSVLTQNFAHIKLDFYKKKEAVQEISGGVRQAIILVQENLYKARQALKQRD